MSVKSHWCEKCRTRHDRMQSCPQKQKPSELAVPIGSAAAASVEAIREEARLKMDCAINSYMLGYEAESFDYAAAAVGLWRVADEVTRQPNK